MDRNIINGFFSEGQLGAPDMINSTTALHTSRDDSGVFLWNYLTNDTEFIDINDGHHDVEYNPITDTFMTIQGVEFQEFEFEGELMPVVGDDIVEYDREGTELFRWDGNLTFPFVPEEFYLRNESRRGELDWMHSNSIYWDIDNDAIYMNVRHLDCVVKVDYQTGETVWVLGRYTGEGPALDLYDLDGSPVDSLFYHAHACELIGEDKFIIYDNDYWNLTRDDPLVGITRYVEFVVDETANTANATWIWTSPPEYYTRAQGDSDRLPNGNTVGALNQAPAPFIVEVNPEGEIVWEWTFNVTDNDVGWRLSPNGLNRFLTEPRVELDATTVVAAEGTNGSLTFSAWDVIQRRLTTDATITILEGTTVLMTHEGEFLPHWQETEFSLDLPILAAGPHNLVLVVENVDGVTSETQFVLDVTSPLPLYLALGGGAIVAVIVIVYILKRKQ
jgi:hypothetical protein